VNIKPFSEWFADSWCVPGSMWAFVLMLILFALTAQGAPTPPPSPIPYAISDEELAKLSIKDIAATAKHVVKLYGEEHQIRLQLQDNLGNAMSSVSQAVSATTNGLVHVDTLQGGIDMLAAHDKKETDRANVLDKKVWWYRLHWWGAWIALGLGVIACGIFAFLKLTGRLAILGTAVASKIPI
jgi:hypothetical protein